MCISPSKLFDGTLVACHRCWQCRENRINDAVGRCIAESKTSAACHAVTLTYGRDTYGDADHPAAAVLTYSDVQKYFKLLRKHGYPLRYFAVGEYGTAKGRAHWHVIMFWQKEAPPWYINAVETGEERTLDDPYWGKTLPDGRFVSHGHINVGKPEYEKFRYNMKYIQKNIGVDEKQGHLAMSKLPPLGTFYFRRLAEKYVRNGLAPQSLEYTFPEARRKNGELHKFLLSGKSAELFLDAYVKAWRDTYPEKPLPNSKLVEEHIDPHAWKGENLAWREPTPVDVGKLAAMLQPLCGEIVSPRDLVYYELLNAFVYRTRDRKRLFGFTLGKDAWEWLGNEARQVREVLTRLNRDILIARASAKPHLITRFPRVINPINPRPLKR